MSECRSLTNFIGNAVATIVVSRWEGAMDEAALGGRPIGQVGPVTALAGVPAGLKLGEARAG